MPRSAMGALACASWTPSSLNATRGLSASRQGEKVNLIMEVKLTLDEDLMDDSTVR